ncbi:SDR family NAD(P)-dependent oxidoreductase [Corynebacterium casei]|uniref:SDR family NAD(P)-dependent oxidoreductase n=1 Tax=Corynebacterium casei TaxID=160386 RepID=UPI003FD33E7F
MSKTYVITGASDGIGAAAARLIHASRPEDRLVIVGRNPEKTRAVARELGVPFHTADFAELDQVRELATELQKLGPIGGLANNAGGLFDTAVRTIDGFERTWQVNVVAPFLLTGLLKDQLCGPDSVVVNTSSIAANLFSRFDPQDPNTFEKFSPARAYGNAKLGDALLSRYLHDHRINSVAFHPGVLSTNFSKTSQSFMGTIYNFAPVASRMGTPSQGGERLVHFLTGLKGIHYQSGEFYLKPYQVGRGGKRDKDRELAHEVFDQLGRELDVSLD